MFINVAKHILSCIRIPSSAKRLIDMTSERPLGYSRKYATRQPEASAEEIRRLFRVAHEKGIEPPDIVECNPVGEKERKLHYYIERRLEPMFMEVAFEVPGFSFVVGCLDKSRQNPINKLGGMQAGDQAIAVYLDIAARATQLVASRNGSEKISNHLLRVSPTSDETILVIGGNKLTKETEVEFRDSWLKANADTDLTQYTYKLEVPYNGSSRAFELNLDAFSKVLTHPEIVTAATFMISRPVTVDPDSEGGFVQEEIRKLENKEVGFYEFLPHSIKIEGGRAEVATQFNESLTTMGIESRSRGSYVEVKLAMSPQDAMAMLPFTRDDWGVAYGLEHTVGTRKGFKELFSRLAGMTFFNTYLGKFRANEALSAVVKAFEDIMGHGIEVIPVAGGYMQYWVDMPPTKETAQRIEAKLRERLHSSRRGEPGYVNLGMEPVVSVIDATTVSRDDLRARSILNSLGLHHFSPRTLGNMDFVLNFFENVDEGVQEEIRGRLAIHNGGVPMSEEDLGRMRLMGVVCDEKKGGRRTIRDAEEVLHTLMNDEQLPDDVKSRKSELKEWFPRFANEWKERIHMLLAKQIENLM